LENNRDALHRLGIAHEDLFIYLVNDLAKLCFNPPGTVGHILTPQKNEPDRENSIWNKIKRGDGGLIASESLAAYLTMLNEAIPAESEFQTVAESEAERVEMDDPNEPGESDENANLLKINDEDGWTNESIPTPERVDNSVYPPDEFSQEKYDEAGRIVENYFRKAREKIPDKLDNGKISSGWEIVWQSVTRTASETTEMLENKKRLYAQGAAGKDEIAEAVRHYLKTRLRYTSGGVPVPHNAEVVQKLFDFL
jgi:hypothetical protein